MINENSARLEKHLYALQSLLLSLEQEKEEKQKLALLHSYPPVQEDWHYFLWIQSHLSPLSPQEEFVIQSILAIGQASIIFHPHGIAHPHDLLSCLLKQLLEIEMFYKYMGGIIGYHVKLLLLIQEQHSAPPSHPDPSIRYLHPPGMNLREDPPETWEAIWNGITALEQMGEIYPVGGAGDRLNLIDEKTGISLPAALLPFLGRTLLEGLIRDLQAREYLAFKLLGKQTVTPIVMMTSLEKQNHAHLLQICESKKWFGRPPNSFAFFMQPVVPVITTEGNWSLSAPLTLTLKPSGHGSLWKLAKEKGIFDWLKLQKREQCLVRQINNPLAAIDQAILALIGIGCSSKKAFGFISCERLINSDEGINVLLEKKENDHYTYCITNIEYTNLAQKGVKDSPAHPKSCFSTYPANTNILFADLSSVEKALEINPIPGQLINCKSKVPFLDSEGHLSLIPGGRLESTMQNIADSLIDDFPYRLGPEEGIKALKTFIIYNARAKTISTTKKSYHPDESTASTPEQAYYDLLSTHSSLLTQCKFDLPPWPSLEDYLHAGPSFVFLFHPGLGPLHSIIQQKMNKGKLFSNAELQLEIAEIAINHLILDGSLLIEASSPLGKRNQEGLLIYGGESRCRLDHVTIFNQGKEKNQPIQNYWKNQLLRKEAIKIFLHEGAEFHAEHVFLEGEWTFEIPPYHHLHLDGSFPIHEWRTHLSHLKAPSWNWKYEWNPQKGIDLH